MKDLSKANEGDLIITEKGEVVTIVGINQRKEKVSVYSGRPITELQTDYQEKLFSFDQESGINFVNEKEKEKYNVGVWKKSNEDKFFEMKEVLPPEENTRGEYNGSAFEIFRMQEAVSGKLKEHFLYSNGNYYSGIFDTGDYINISDIVTL